MPEFNASDAESRQQTESDENSALALLTTVCPKPPGVPRGKLAHGSETMSGTLTNFFGSAEDDWLHPAVHAATKQQQPSPGLPQSAECWSRPTKRVTVGGTTNLVKKLRGSRTRQKQERLGNKHWIVRFELHAKWTMKRAEIGA